MPRVNRRLRIAEDSLGIGSDNPSGGASAALAASSARGHPEVWARTAKSHRLRRRKLSVNRGRLIELLYVITSSSPELEAGYFAVWPVLLRYPNHGRLERVL